MRRAEPITDEASIIYPWTCPCIFFLILSNQSTSLSEGNPLGKPKASLKADKREPLKLLLWGHGSLLPAFWENIVTTI